MCSAAKSINPLPPEVAKQINSSTAIPSLNNVVVGLVENSLDAKASVLDIEVDYGRGSCTVEDDGFGIPPSEFAQDGGLAKSHCEGKASRISLRITDLFRYLQGERPESHSWMQWDLSILSGCSFNPDHYLSLPSQSLPCNSHLAPIEARFEVNPITCTLSPLLSRTRH